MAESKSNTRGLFSVKIGAAENPAYGGTSFIAGAVRVEVPGAISINGLDFVPSGAKLIFQHDVVYIDPVGFPPVADATLVLITHGHPDHFDIGAIPSLMGPSCMVAGPAKVIRKLRHAGIAGREVEAGSSLASGGAELLCTPARNTRFVIPFLKAHPGSDGNVGYLVKAGGASFWFAGDTDALPEFLGDGSLSGLDVAFVPIGGDRLTMTAVEAARLVSSILPRLAVPVHFAAGRGIEGRFISALSGAVVSRLPFDARVT